MHILFVDRTEIKNISLSTANLGRYIWFRVRRLFFISKMTFICLLMFGSLHFFGRICDAFPRIPNNCALVIQEIPEWEPGMVLTVRQTVVLSNGVGQYVIIKDNQIIKLNKFEYPISSTDIFKPEQYFLMKNSYLKDKEENGLIVEGNPPIVKFIFYNSERVKIIDCPAESLPELLKSLKNQLSDHCKLGHEVGATGFYVMAQLLSQQENTEVAEIVKPSRVPDYVLRQCRALSDAIISPALLVKLTDVDLELLKKELRIKDCLDQSGFFFKSERGIIKLRFFYSK